MSILSDLRPLGAALATVLLLSASAPPAFAAGVTQVIQITHFTFAPKELTVAAGTTVRWVNHDETPHTITSLPGVPKVLASKAMDTDDQFEFTFTQAGDFQYLCTVHPFMTAVVHVTAP